MKWFIYSLKHIFDYKGRARRAEFGWFYLTNFLLNLGVYLVFFVLAMVANLFAVSGITENIIILGLSLLINIGLTLLGLATTLAVFSLTARRLHDLGWSGWWQLVYYILPIFCVPVLLSISDAATTSVATEGMATIFGVVIMAWIVLSFIFFGILLFKDGQRFENKYGQDPKSYNQLAPKNKLASQEISTVKNTEMQKSDAEF